MTVKACASHKTLPIPFELGSQTENYPPPPRHIFCHLYFLVVAIPWLLILFCADMTMFLLVDSCLFVGVEPCLRQSVWVAAPCSGVAFPSPNAIEWVADPQVVCRFPPLLRLGGSPTLSHALPWLGRRPCNPLRWLVGGPSLPCSVWWVEDLQML